MKFTKKIYSQIPKYIKALLTILILGSSTIIEVNSKINTKANYTTEKTTNYFKSSTQKKSQRKNSIKKNLSKLKNNPQSKDSVDNEIPKDSDTTAVKEKKLSAFFLKIKNNKSLTGDVTLLQGKIKSGCVRVFDKPEFDVKSKVTDLCTTAEIEDLGKTKIPVSIIISDDLKLLFYDKAKPQDSKILFSDTKRINKFPFDNSLKFGYDKYLQIKVIKEGEAIVTNMGLYYGKLKFINKKTTQAELGFENILAIALGNNTYLSITLKNGKNIQIANDNTHLRIEDIKEIDILKFENIVYPTIAPNCIMIFKKPYFESPPNSEPDTFCDDFTILNDSSLQSPLSKELSKEDKDKKMENLDQLSDEYRLSIKSLLVGSNITAVLFKKPYHEGQAYPVKDMIVSTEYFELNENIQSIYLLKAGCYILFEGSNYEFLGYEHFRLCYSLNSVKLARWGETWGTSIILAKNTVIDLFEGANYTGKRIRLKTSNEHLHVQGLLSVGSIKVISPSVKEIDLLSKEFNNPGCLLFYEKNNYEGHSRLHCEEDHQNPKPEKKKEMRSVKISKGDDMIIYYEKALMFMFDVERTIHIMQSTPNLPIDDDSKFKMFSVLKEGCVMFFDDCDYKGSIQKVCEDASDLSAEPESLSDYKSILVGENTTVTLYDLINFNTSVGKQPFKTSKSISCFEKTESQKYLVSKLTSIEFGMSDNPQKMNFIPDTGYSIGNLLMGVFLGLFGEDFQKSNNSESERNTFISCIPSSLKKGISTSDSNEVETSVVDFKESHDGFFSNLLKKSGSIMRKFMKWYCNFKDKMFWYIEKLVLFLGFIKPDQDQSKKQDIKEQVTDFLNGKKDWGLGKKFIDYADEQLSILDKKEAEEKANTNNNNNTVETLSKESKKVKKRRNVTPTRRKFRVHNKVQSKKFWDFLIKFKLWIVEQTESFYKNYILAPFEKIKTVVVGFINKITNFFKSRFFLLTIKALGCASYGSLHLLGKFEGFIANIQVLITGITTAVAGIGIIILIDFLLALLCNIKYFRLALNYFYLGNKWFNKAGSNNKPTAFSYYGLAIGTTLNSIATATPFTDYIVHILHSAKEIADYNKVKRFRKEN